MATKNTNAIDSELYPKVSNLMSKNLSKYKAMISRFISKRQQALYDTFPSSRILYGTPDIEDLYASVGITEAEIMSAISKTYYYPISNFNPRAAKNPQTILAMCIVKYFYNKNDKKNLELACIYMAFSGNFYPSIHYAFFPIEPSQYRHVIDYVVNEYMDMRYDIKATGSLIGAITILCNTWIESYSKLIKSKTSDEDYVYMIQQLHTRIKSMIKNCASAYYECYDKKLYMTYNSDNMSENAAEFRVAESDLSRAELLTQKTMGIITTTDVSYVNCKRASNDSIKTEELKSIIEEVVNNTDNLDKLQELIRLIIINYMHDCNKSTIDDPIGFLKYSTTAKPNSNDKNINREKEIIEKFLDENSPSYRKRKSRLATKLAYNRAFKTYLVLTIIDAIKK